MPSQPRRNPAFPALLALLPALLASGCHSTRSYSVNGQRLRYERWIEAHGPVPTQASADQGPSLEMVLDFGSVRVQPGASGELRARARVREYTAGDAQLLWEQGQLRLVSSPGQPAMALEVDVYAGQGLGDLSITTDLGDLEVYDVAVNGRLHLSSNLGDLRAAGLGSPSRLELDTNLGDIEVERLHCAELRADSDLGSIEIDNVKAERADLNTDLGDVEVSHSAFLSATASTELGDIEGLDQALVAGRADPAGTASPQPKKVVRGDV
jgi:hypothetical protein